MIFFYKYLNKIILRNVITRRLILLTLDAFLISLSLFLSNYFINNLFFNYEGFSYLIPTYLFCGIIVFIFSGQYKAITKYVGSKLFYTSLLRNSFLFFLILLVGLANSSFSIDIKFLVLNFILLTFLIVGSRLFLRDLINRLNIFNENKPNVLIYGAGNAGAQLASSIKISGKYKILGFIDDSQSLIGRELYGIRILSFKDIRKFSDIDHVLLAIPSLDKSSRRRIIDLLKCNNLDVLQIPSLDEITSGKVSIDKLKPVELVDLLGRDTVAPVKSLLGPGISNLVVCVTGGGGSIGSELSRQILGLNAKKIILIDNSEHNLYTIYEELNENPIVKEKIIPILGDVTNKKLVNDFIEKYKVDLIFHAAAYKHVPLVEHNPIAGLINNVLSTSILCEAAKEKKIKHFILISTDKAVRPTNVMGASKRLAEMIVQAYANDEMKKSINNDELIKFSMVRFGNVLGSSGSVIPLFKRQIKQGGPITLTHKDITRFFMTIQEAVELVLQSVSIAENGDVVLLDMGKPVKIKYLAEQLVRLSGLKIKDEKNKDGDIEIKCTGLRSGEKLYEELLIDAKSEPTKHPLIYRAKESSIELPILLPKINLLKEYLYREDKKSSFKLLAELVPEWK